MTTKRIGFRIELPSKYYNSILLAESKFNKISKNVKITDVCNNGYTFCEKLDDMVIVCKKTHNELGYSPSGFVCFSLLAETKDNKKNIERVIKIINVLGNDKIIKEKTTSFMSNASLLCHIPEIVSLKDSILEINKLIPNFIKISYYYSPDVRI